MNYVECGLCNMNWILLFMLTLILCDQFIISIMESVKDENGRELSIRQGVVCADKR